MRLRQLMTLGVLSFLGSGCAPTTDNAATSDSAAGVAATASTDLGAVRQSIEAANAKLVDAVKRSDTASIAALYVDDAVVMWSEAPMYRGRAAVMKAWADMLAHGAVKDFSLKTDDVMAGGDLAVETGTYEMTYQPEAAKEVRFKGKYVSVWKRQSDGLWKVFREIDNSNGPPKS